MHPTLNYLFNELNEAVVIVSSASYRVKYVNPAGERLFQLMRGEPVEDSWMTKQLSAIELGYLETPIGFEVELAGNNRSRANVTFLKSPAGNDLIIFAKNSCPEAVKPISMASLAELIDCEMRNPISQLMVSLNDTMLQLEKTASRNRELLDAVNRTSGLAADVKDVMQKIELMASCFKTTPLLGNDRIPAFGLIQEILSANEDLIQERCVRISFSGVNDGLPVLYGSKNFVLQALAGYFRHFLLEADKRVLLQVAAKATHAFLLISFENYGKASGHVTVNRSETRVIDRVSGNFPAIDYPAPCLPLMLCKRVIELHGGRLRHEELLDGLNKVTFELPVGAPMLNDVDLGLKQAQRYAQDLMSLIHRKKPYPNLH